MQKPVQGVAIVWEDEAAPTFIVPFPGCDLVGAFATDSDSVVCVGSRNRRGGSGGHAGWTLLARFERPRARIVRRGEMEGLKARGALASRDGRSIFVSAHEGFAAINAVTLEIERRIELLRFDGEAVSTSSYNERDGCGPWIYGMNSKRWGPKFAGWQSIMIQYGFQVGETADGHIAHIERWLGRTPRHPELREQGFHIVDWRRSTVCRGLVRSQIEPTILDRMDPDAELLHVTRRQVALFRASPLHNPERARFFACSDSAEHAIVLYQWSILDPVATPLTIAVRTAKPDVWTAAFERAGHKMPKGMPGTPEEIFNLPSPMAETETPVFWASAAVAFLPQVYEDPRDGLVWLAFADDHIRSIDEAGRLGPLIALGGQLNVPSDRPYVRQSCPTISFTGRDLIVVYAYGEDWPFKMGRYVFRAVDMVDRTEPITLMPVRSGPLPGSHAKAFSAFIRDRRHDRFTLPDWSRDSVAAALDAQRAAIAASLPDLVDPEQDRLTFSYKVAGKPVKEAAFFRRIAKEALPVAPELRAMLLAYTDALGEGGEGVQPWQDPDEGVGGLGPALHALALLDPDSLDALRAYLETRDGEHECFCLDVVVPAFFKRHGWRDTKAVRFGVYATLNRYWGGRKPPRDFDGMRTAMTQLLAPEDVVEVVRREAEHFERKPGFGYDAAAYRAAFRTLLDPALPFEAAVLAGLDEPPSA